MMAKQVLESQLPIYLAVYRGPDCLLLEVRISYTDLNDQIIQSLCALLLSEFHVLDSNDHCLAR